MRLFPERKILLRTGARHRYFTLSRRAQMLATAAAAAFVTWNAAVTAQWLDSAVVIADKDREISDLRLAYQSAFDQMGGFESEFRGLATRVAGEIESIQGNLALLSRHDILAAKPPVAAQPTSAAAKAAPPRNIAAINETLQEQLAQLDTSLAQLKTSHTAFVAHSAELATAQVGRLETALSSLGIDVAALAPAADKSAGRGGPFIPRRAAGDNRQTNMAVLNDAITRWNGLTIAMQALPFAAPIEDVRLTSRFGPRDDPFNRMPAVHEGLDFAGPYKSPVRATGAGTVVFAGRNGRYGRLVEVDHGQGLATRYAHLAKISVKKGQKVARGTVIGLLGSSGRSTGPHLHYEVRVANEAKDPLKFIGIGKNVLKGQ